MKAKSEQVAPGIEQIPYSFLEALGSIFAEGMEKYGEGNWKNGAGDKPYQRERLRHALRHLHLWAEGDRSENHLAKVAWFCCTQIELEKLEQIVELPQLCYGCRQALPDPNGPVRKYFCGCGLQFEALTSALTGRSSWKQI